MENIHGASKISKNHLFDTPCNIIALSKRKKPGWFPKSCNFKMFVFVVFCQFRMEGSITCNSLPCLNQIMWISKSSAEFIHICDFDDDELSTQRDSREFVITKTLQRGAHPSSLPFFPRPAYERNKEGDVIHSPSLHTHRSKQQIQKFKMADPSLKKHVFDGFNQAIWSGRDLFPVIPTFPPFFGRFGSSLAPQSFQIQPQASQQGSGLIFSAAASAAFTLEQRAVRKT